MSDPGWIGGWRELKHMHQRKSSTYGDDAEPLANFTKLATLTGAVPERYALERLVEKSVRALHMIDAGDADGVAEYPDIASLALCAEALRRRRFDETGTANGGAAVVAPPEITALYSADLSQSQSLSASASACSCRGQGPCACDPIDEADDPRLTVDEPPVDTKTRLLRLGHRKR